ncbi:MAG TPA: trypsin-like peptidase domain-containing protein [Isosphaeraceae bacterium]|nr:trypsin-like peptidase domain-containing protein [Isosphaeraceae bacterium]
MNRCLRLVIPALLALPAVPAWAQEKSTVELIKQVEPSIVRVIVTGMVKEPGAGGPALGVNSPVEVDKLDEYYGTGFIIDFQGHILTNSHVAKPTEPAWKSEPEIKVEFMGMEGMTLPAKLVGNDELADLAVLKVEQDPSLRSFNPALLTADGRLHPLKFADPARVEVGTDVISVGFAKNIDGRPSVNKGIISADRRSVRSGLISGLLQTDAIINHGNSGGPLLNMRGEVVGVNTYTMDPRVKPGQDISAAMKAQGLEIDEAYGLFYARSVATAAPMAQKLIQKGAIGRVTFGISSMVTLTQTDARLSAILTRGTMVVRIDKDSPAAAAGMLPGDVIFEVVQGHPNDLVSHTWRIENAGDLKNAQTFIAPGETVTIRFRRPSQEMLSAFIKSNYVCSDDRGRAFCHTELMSAVVKAQ